MKQSTTFDDEKCLSTLTQLKELWIASSLTGRSFPFLTNLESLHLTLFGAHDFEPDNISYLTTLVSLRDHFNDQVFNEKKFQIGKILVVAGSSKITDGAIIYLSNLKHLNIRCVITKYQNKNGNEKKWRKWNE